MSDINERWVILDYKQIKKDYYEISNNGRIRIIKNGLMRKTQIHNNYEIFTAYTGNREHKYVNYLVHILVAESFIMKPYVIDILNKPIKLVVDHIDFDKLNNSVLNLRRSTQYRNIKHSRMHNRYNDYCENSKNAKYTNNFIKRMCIMRDKGYSNIEILNKMNLPNKNKYHSLLTHLRKYDRWKRVSRIVYIS